MREAERRGLLPPRRFCGHRAVSFGSEGREDEDRGSWTCQSPVAGAWKSLSGCKPRAGSVVRGSLSKCLQESYFQRRPRDYGEPGCGPASQPLGPAQSQPMV